MDNVQKGTIVAGVRIPPKPLEPDNCCMSGCVNCTWFVKNLICSGMGVGKPEVCANTMQQGYI